MVSHPTLTHVQDREVEAKVYEQISLVSCVVGFSWSKWSSEVGEQQFVVKACECMNQEVSRENNDPTFRWSGEVG